MFGEPVDVPEVTQGFSFLECVSNEADAWDEAMAQHWPGNELADRQWWVDGVSAGPGPDAAFSGGPGPAAGPGNTAIANSQHVERWQVAGGVDMLEVTIYGWFKAGYEETTKLLEAGRQGAMARGGHRRVDVEGASLFMRERGCRWGNAFLPWVGDYDGIMFALGKPGQSDKCCVAKITIGSLKLMRDGHRAAWAEALRILETLGVGVERNTVFRIDICCDLPGVAVDGYCEAISRGEVISRIRSQAAFYKGKQGEWTGCSIGSSSGVRVRIYDKLRELEDRPEGAEAKRFCLIERRWGCLPERATRVEFQIRGEWMRRQWQDCSSVEDCFDRLDAISDYLVERFFRIVDGEVDRENNNQQRAELSPLWAQAVEGFNDWIEREALPMLRMEKSPPNREKRARRLYASAMSLAALSPGYVVDRVTFIQRTMDALLRAMPPEYEMMGELRKRWEKLNATGESGVFTFEDTEEMYSPGWEVELRPVPGLENEW